jgi:alkylation response protein AidB-like acyl-CoA dehydrogenase
VRVPDSARVGEVNGGWAVLCSALEFEHANGFGAELERLLHVAVDEASKPDDLGHRLIDDPLVRARMATVAIETEVARLLEMRAAWLIDSGQHPVTQGPMAKLYSSEAFTRAATRLLDGFGADGLARRNGLGTSGIGVVEHAFRHSQVTRIYAGTSEIHRSLIAERGLGLPRTRTAG